MSADADKPVRRL